MVTCPSCGRENAGHFNFCLDCGTELSRPAAPAAAAVEPPPVAMGVAVGAPVPAAAPAPVTAASMPASSQPAGQPASFGAPAAAPPHRTEHQQGAVTQTPGVQCPVCKSVAATGLKFCGECGAKLDPTAPNPNAQSQAAAVAKQTQFLHAADLAKLMQPKARLITLDPAGREGMSYNLTAAETVCGRMNGLILLDDPCVSPSHCVFRFNAGRLSVADTGSLNGVFVRLRQEVELQHGDIIRMGRQLVRYEEAAAIPVENPARMPDDDARMWGTPAVACFGRLVQLTDDMHVGDVRLLRGNEIKVGREQGDITFPGDGFVSGNHCVFTNRNGKAFLRDVGSSNGTYVRIRSERILAQDDFLLLGNQMLRVDQR